MREDGYASDAEGGFNLQSLGSMLQTAAPAAMQGAGAGAAFGPWGALIGGLGAGALSIASQAQGPSSTAAPPLQRPAIRPAPSFAPAAPIAPVAPSPSPAPAPPAVSPAPSPAPAFAAAIPAATAAPGLAAPAAVAGPAAGGSFGQVLALLGNPQVQALLGSFASGQRPSTAAAAEADEDAEAVNGGGAIGWLIASGVARPRA